MIFRRSFMAAVLVFATSVEASPTTIPFPMPLVLDLSGSWTAVWSGDAVVLKVPSLGAELSVSLFNGNVTCPEMMALLVKGSPDAPREKLSWFPSLWGTAIILRGPSGALAAACRTLGIGAMVTMVSFPPNADTDKSTIDNLRELFIALDAALRTKADVMSAASPPDVPPPPTATTPPAPTPAPTPTAPPPEVAAIEPTPTEPPAPPPPIDDTTPRRSFLSYLHGITVGAHLLAADTLDDSYGASLGYRRSLTEHIRIALEAGYTQRSGPLLDGRVELVQRWGEWPFGFELSALVGGDGVGIGEDMATTTGVYVAPDIYIGGASELLFDPVDVRFLYAWRNGDTVDSEWRLEVGYTRESGRRIAFRYASYGDTGHFLALLFRL